MWLPCLQTSDSEIRRLLEEAVEKLPDAYRTIFMLRDVEDLSTTDAADALEISEDNVKVRLHRARALLRKSLYARAGMERKEAFTFHAVRCDRVVKNVFERIQKHGSKNLRGEHAVTLGLVLPPVDPEFSVAF
jgi:RNA polymerase sigma-70 factor, ECF subfamily